MPEILLSRRPSRERVWLCAPEAVISAASRVLALAGVEVVSQRERATILARLHDGPPAACDVLVRGAEGGRIAAWLVLGHRKMNALATGSQLADRVVSFIHRDLVDPCARLPTRPPAAPTLRRLIADFAG